MIIAKVRDYRYRQDLWTNANNYQSDNLFLLRGWISDIKDKTAEDATSYGWMDGWTDR